MGMMATIICSCVFYLASVLLLERHSATSRVVSVMCTAALAAAASGTWLLRFQQQGKSCQCHHLSAVCCYWLAFHAVSAWQVACICLAAGLTPLLTGRQPQAEEHMLPEHDHLV